MLAFRIYSMYGNLPLNRVLCFFFISFTVALHFYIISMERWCFGKTEKCADATENATDLDIVSMTKIQLNSSFYLIATLRPMAHVKNVAETNSNSSAPFLTRHTMTMLK